MLTGDTRTSSSTHAAQRLPSSAGKALEKLGESVALELVGRVQRSRRWIDAATAEDQIVVARTLAGGGAVLEPEWSRAATTCITTS